MIVFIEGVTVHPGVLVSSAEVGDDNKVSVKLNNGDEVGFTVIVCTQMSGELAIIRDFILHQQIQCRW